MAFALDLSVDSQPNQIVLARIKPAESLADTWTDLQEKMAKYRASLKSVPDFPDYKEDELGQNESLFVPAMHWRVCHHFRELEGTNRLLLNACCPGWFMKTACQEVEFRLDAEGAIVASSARVIPAAGLLPRPPTAFKFDRPFLIYLKKRDAKHPFVVMWVNDAELLLPGQPGGSGSRQTSD